MCVFWCMSYRILLGRREVVLTTKVCWLVSEPSRGDCGKSARQRTTMATLTRIPARPAPIRTVRAAHSLRVPSRGVKQTKVRSFPFTCSSGLLKRAQMQEELEKKKPWRIRSWRTELIFFFFLLLCAGQWLPFVLLFIFFLDGEEVQAGGGMRALHIDVCVRVYICKWQRCIRRLLSRSPQPLPFESMFLCLLLHPL